MLYMKSYQLMLLLNNIVLFSMNESLEFFDRFQSESSRVNAEGDRRQMLFDLLPLLRGFDISKAFDTVHQICEAWECITCVRIERTWCEQQVPKQHINTNNTSYMLTHPARDGVICARGTSYMAIRNIHCFASIVSDTHTTFRLSQPKILITKISCFAIKPC